MAKTCGRTPLKLKARGFENRRKSGPKSFQNASLEASGRPLGANPASRASPEPSRRGSGRAWGFQKTRCWQPRDLLGRQVGRFHPPGRSPGGSRRGSGRSFWEHFCGWAWRIEKMKKNRDFCIFFDVCFKCSLCFFFALPAAPAQARTLKKQQIAWKVCKNSLVHHFLAERKTAECKIIFFKIRPENSSKKRMQRNMRKTFRNLPKITKYASQNQPRRPPEPSCVPSWRPEAPKIAPGGFRKQRKQLSPRPRGPKDNCRRFLNLSLGGQAGVARLVKASPGGLGQGKS